MKKPEKKKLSPIMLQEDCIERIARNQAITQYDAWVKEKCGEIKSIVADGYITAQNRKTDWVVEVAQAIAKHFEVKDV